jgi:hypothetical protein
MQMEHPLLHNQILLNCYTMHLLDLLSSLSVESTSNIKDLKVRNTYERDTHRIVNEVKNEAS